MLGKRSTENYTHIIFDFDGTIANSLPQSVEVMNDLLKRDHKNKLSEKDVSKILSLDSIDEIFETVGVRRWTLPYYVFRFRRNMKDKIDEVEPFEDIEVALSFLYDRATLSVASSNSQDNVEAFLKKHGLREYFDTVIGDISVFGKGRTLRKYIRANKLKKKHTLYVGDEVRDILSCQKIKLDIAAVTWGPTPKETLKKRRPTYLISKPKQLTKFAR